MADLNKVFLIGRLTHDPELRYTPNGAPVSDLRLATSRQWTGKDGERREETLYIDVTVWNRQAENCCQFLKKGRMIHVEGYLKSESWETQAGEKRTKIKVEAERVQFLDRRDDSGSPAPAHDFDDAASAPPRRPGPGPGADAPARNPSNGASRYAPGGQASRRAPVPQDPEGDDDIPF